MRPVPPLRRVTSLCFVRDVPIGTLRLAHLVTPLRFVREFAIANGRIVELYEVSSMGILHTSTDFLAATISIFFRFANNLLMGIVKELMGEPFTINQII